VTFTVVAEPSISRSLWEDSVHSVAEADGKRSYDVRHHANLIISTDICPVAFKVYDVDRDGFISNGELFLVLKMMVGNNLKVGIFLQESYYYLLR
jgi:hypothetical protein